MLALAYAHSGQPEQAAEMAKDAMTTAQITGSRRIAADLSRVQAILKTSNLQIVRNDGLDNQRNIT